MRSRPTDGRGDSCSNCSGVAIVATAAAGANQYTRYAHARYDAWAIDEGCSETGRQASRVWKHHWRSGTTHSWTTPRLRSLTTTNGVRPPGRGAGSRTCRNGLLRRARSWQRTGRPSSPSRCTRHEKNSMQMVRCCAGFPDYSPIGFLRGGGGGL